MKKVITCLALFLSFVTMAQKREYLDANKRKCSGPEGAKYYRVVQLEDGAHMVGDFYVSNDQLEMAVPATKSNGDYRFEGSCKSFHENGKLKEEGMYKANEQVGTWKAYHENGQISEERLYQGDKMLYTQCWDDAGTPLLTNGTGTFKRKSMLPANGQYDYLDVLNSEVIAFFNIKGNDSIYTVVEETTTYKGGMPSLYKFIGKTLRYPADARRYGIEGKVFVEFVVDKNGGVRDARCLKGIGGGCDEEAVRVINETKHWTPGRVKGKVVMQKMVLPIGFKLG